MKRHNWTYLYLGLADTCPDLQRSKDIRELVLSAYHVDPMIQSQLNPHYFSSQYLWQK